MPSSVVQIVGVADPWRASIARARARHARRQDHRQPGGEQDPLSRHRARVELRALCRAVQELEAGYTWVNALQIAHDELPFGGTKQSGYGKEHGIEAFYQYTDQKSVVYGLVGS